MAKQKQPDDNAGKRANRRKAAKDTRRKLISESDNTPLFGSLDAMPDPVYKHLFASLIILLLAHFYLWFLNGGYLNLTGAFPFFLWGFAALVFYFRNSYLLFTASPRWGLSAHFFDYVFFLASFILHGGAMLFFGNYSGLLSWNGPLLLVLLFWGFVLIGHTFLVLQPRDE